MNRLHGNTDISEYLLITAAVWAGAAYIFVYLPRASLIVPAAGIFTVLLFLGRAFPERTRKIADLCFRWRWAIALILFAVCVILRLHGSSIGVYDEIFPTAVTAHENILFGSARWIRSDEFGVSVPKYFSQAVNDYRLYSTRMSIHPMNMVLDYYSPVWDWTILGKPLAWGFLLFGNEIGLSWYWCGEIILLFMTALEMFLILTDRQRMISVTGAFMIALSPAVQWWVMPHIPPALLYAMALFCVTYWFFTAKSMLTKWVSAVLAFITILGFVLAIFPSYQVPCGYTVLILLAVCLYRDRKEITFTKQQWYRFVLPAAAALVILGRFVLMSREDLSLLLNTVYPGDRSLTGGGYSVSYLFTDLISYFLPYKNVSFSNNCEVSTYIHFGVLFLVLSPYLLIKLRKERDPAWTVGLALTGILLTEIWFMLVGFPQWLAKISLLSFCNRMHQVYGWTATIYTVWGLSVLVRHPAILPRGAKIVLPAVYALVSLAVLDQVRIDFFESFVIRGIVIGRVMLGLCVIVTAGVLYFAVFRRERLMHTFLILVMIFCGATVNPLARGIGSVTNHPVSAAIAEISREEPESCWLCTDSVFLVPNFVMANGARVLDATNFYPDPEKWKLLDPEGKYDELTNRYANETAELTEDEVSVELLSPDHIRILLNPQALKILGIRYLFTPVDHTAFLAEHGIACTYVTGQDGYGIYRLDYQE